VAAVEPLRRHVARRADERAGGGEAGVVGGLCDAEVGERDPPVVAQHDVGRLDVAVHHAALVRGAQRAQEPPRHLERGVLRQGPERATTSASVGASMSSMTMWSTPPSLTTSYTVTIAGSFSRPAVRASRRSRSRKSRRSSGPALGEVQLLHRDVPPHHAVLGAPDDAHAAASELGEHDVAATDDPRRRHGSHGRSSLVTTPSACH
jgi:hypothetical protein